jgi:hypothetical protein
VPLEVLEREEVVPQPEKWKGICVGSTVAEGVVSARIFSTMICPRMTLTKVHVSVSPERSVTLAEREARLTETVAALMELLQLICVVSHIDPASPSETVKAPGEEREGARIGKRRVGVVVEEEAWPPLPEIVKEKSCG